MRNRLRDAFLSPASSTLATRSLRPMRSRRLDAVAAQAQLLEPRRLLDAWVSGDPVGGGPGPMYAVYASDTGTSGVMLNANDGTNGGVFYKESNGLDDDPTFFHSGSIVAEVRGIDMDGDNVPDDIVLFVDSDHLYWANNGSSHEIGSSALSGENELANICGVGDTGFYFSTYNSGAKLWFAEHSGSDFTLSSYNMTAVATPWQTDTRISWITAVPGNASYDVMYSGDRAYRHEHQPNPGVYHRHHDGRELWGMVDGATGPTRIHDNIGNEDPITGHPAPWYDGLPGGKCPEQMVISKINVAIDGVLYFATQSNTLSQFWKSDGTSNGTNWIFHDEELLWYEWLSNHYEDTTAGFMQVAGMDGYLDPGPDGNLNTSDDEPRVFFWLSYANPSDLWVYDGTSVNYVGGFDLRYCSGPEIPGQHVDGRAFVISKDPSDPDYGTAYFTAGVKDVDAQTHYALYKIAPGAASATWLWETPTVDLGGSSASNWLTPIDGKLYFRGWEPNTTGNVRDRQLYVYDPSTGVSAVDLSADSVPDMDVSWLVWDSHADNDAGRLYYLSLYGTLGTNVKLCWWDLQP